MEKLKVHGKALWIKKAVALIMKLFLNKTGGAADIDSLTAIPSDVADGDVFIGEGSDEKQKGTMIDRGSPDYNIPVNGKINLPKGVYDGGTLFNSTPTLGAQSAAPGSKIIVIPTKNKFMMGKVTVPPVKNLIPSNIKKGEYVGGVGPGLWEGYINDDPNTPFYYGTFYAGQSVTILEQIETWDKGILEITKKNIEVTNRTLAGKGAKSAIVFNVPIELSSVRTLEVTLDAVSLSSSSSAQVQCTLYLAEKRITDYILRADYKINPNMGVTTGMDGFQQTKSWSGTLKKSINIKGKRYLYLSFDASLQATDIKMVRFS